MVAHNRKTNEMFLEELSAKKIKYIPQEPYVDSHTKIKFLCPDCQNEIFITPTNVLNGRGCSFCRNESARARYSKSHEEFVRDVAVKNPSIAILEEYKNFKTPIKVMCKKHNRVFIQSPAVSLRGCGCDECMKERISQKNRSTVEYFLEKARKNSPHLVVLEPEKYVNARTKMKVRCKIHGNVFSATADRISVGLTNCPVCAMSSGEHSVALYLDKNGYSYKTQYTPEDGELGKMRFDFFIQGINTIIEYDGAQHFVPVEHWGGQEGLLKSKERDEMKNNYCKQKGIRLVRIPYTEKDVARYLSAVGL